MHNDQPRGPYYALQSSLVASANDGWRKALEEVERGDDERARALAEEAKTLTRESAGLLARGVEMG